MQLGYAPNTLAQSFRRGKTNVIMVVIPSVGDPFFTEVMEEETIGSEWDEWTDIGGGA